MISKFSLSLFNRIAEMMFRLPLADQLEKQPKAILEKNNSQGFLLPLTSKDWFNLIRELTWCRKLIRD